MHGVIDHSVTIQQGNDHSINKQFTCAPHEGDNLISHMILNEEKDHIGHHIEDEERNCQEQRYQIYVPERMLRNLS